MNYLAHSVKDMTKTRIDHSIFGDTEEGCKRRWIGNVVGGKRTQRIDFVGNEMNLMFITESHILNQHFSRIASTA
jgi:hypothetical protein